MEEKSIHPSSGTPGPSTISKKPKTEKKVLLQVPPPPQHHSNTK
jgi:hypothetical protein